MGSNGNMYQNNPRMEIKASEVVVPHIPLPSVDKKHSNRAMLLLGVLFFHLKQGSLKISTGKFFVQALQYKVVLGSTLCKLCSTK